LFNNPVTSILTHNTQTDNVGLQAAERKKHMHLTGRPRIVMVDQSYPRLLAAHLLHIPSINMEG
jgi:hypothetical protein